ncbi:TatD family hydrolase [Shewanella sp. Isolate11]|uniref:TatD family hydrolase n=1 Tax=Shewanella sp. Isolate11 TaxID=2908530 RepID=UPI001EFEAEF1|nr:TatD family hydrolase [Shewanella sp. Isolate11]
MSRDAENNSQLRFIDSHIHLDFDEFDTIRQPLMQSLQQAGLVHSLIPGVSSHRWQKQLRIAKQYQSSYALGIHPWYCDEDWRSEIEELSLLLEQHQKDKRLVAVGECGLDGLNSNKGRDNGTVWQRQLGCFEAQIQLAKTHHLPLIIHSVRAHHEVLGLLRQYSPIGGVIHGFYGSVELAEQYLACGFKLGIGHLLLNEQAKKLDEVIIKLPLTAFVIETDIALVQQRKQLQTVNNTDESCSILPLVVEKIAILQKKSNVLISEQVFQNTVQLFEL